MKKAAVVLALCFVASAARASPILYSPATGPPNVVGNERSGFWSEPADLNGLVATSEQILVYGMETECANDFYLEGYQSIQTATWWGCYYNNSAPCASGMTTPGFNLRIYEDAGCTPGQTVADLSITSFAEQSVGCQTGSMYPIFKWTANVGVSPPGDRFYWFGAQMKDHYYPPQAGRLASGAVVGCGSVFKSAFFGYPDWTPVLDAFGVAFDCSQEFDCMICSGSSSVDTDPPARPSAKASWGTIKGLYR